MFNFIERIKEGMAHGIADMTLTMTGGIINFAMEMMAGLMNFMIDPLSWDFVNNIVFYSQIIAASILCVKIIYDAIVIYILRVSGEASDGGDQLLIGAVWSAIAIYLIPAIMKYLFYFGALLARGVVAVGDFSNNTFTQSWEATKASFAGQLAGMAFFGIVGWVLLFLVAAFMIAIVIIQLGARSGELIVMSVVGPFFAINIRGGGFKGWWQRALGLSVGFSIQLLMMRMSFFALELGFAGQAGPITGLVLFVGFLWATIKSPSVVAELIGSTGLGRIAGSATNMAVMRKVLSKGVA